MREASILKRSLQGTVFILSQQFLTRIITFASNIYITRRSEITLLGALHDLELFHSTALFLSRESIRMALLRNSAAAKAGDREQYLVNMAWIPFLLFLCALPFLFYLDLFSMYPKAYYLFIAATGIELLSEPLYIYCQHNLMYNVRVVIIPIFTLESGRSSIFSPMCYQSRWDNLSGKIWTSYNTQRYIYLWNLPKHFCYISFNWVSHSIIKGRAIENISSKKNSCQREYKVLEYP
jgi:hypothetical protein